MKKPKHKDLLKCLSDNGIEYRITGGQKTERTIAICCPFCDDGNFHLGIFKDGFNYHCFRCGANGSFSSLCKKLKIKFVYGDSRTLTGRAGPDLVKQVRSMFEEPHIGLVSVDCEIPNSCLSVFDMVTGRSKLHSLNLNRFIKARELDIHKLKQIGALYCYSGFFNNRIILPVCEKGVMVGFQARDVTGLASDKYLSSKGFRTANHLYNYDIVYKTSPKKIYIVEGIFDALRIGYGALASFTKSLSKNQMRLIEDLSPAEIIICWDSDALIESLKLASRLSCKYHVKVLHLPEGEDPDSYGKENLKQLELGTSYYTLISEDAI